MIGRHDTPEEKLHDDIRKKINASHRFESFAGEREQNCVKWYVLLRRPIAPSYPQLSRHIDGHDYFYALSEMLESARECIFIMVWVMRPLIIDVRVTRSQGLVVDS